MPGDDRGDFIELEFDAEPLGCLIRVTSSGIELEVEDRVLLIRSDLIVSMEHADRRL